MLAVITFFDFRAHNHRRLRSAPQSLESIVLQAQVCELFLEALKFLEFGRRRGLDRL